MAKVKIGKEEADLELLDRNKILFQEIARVVKSHQGEMMLFQGFTLGKPSLVQGRFHNMTWQTYPGEEGKLYCLDFEYPLHYWFNENRLVVDNKAAFERFPINYNGGELVRLADSRAELLFENTGEVMEWTKEFRKWRSKLSREEERRQYQFLEGFFGLMRTYGLSYTADVYKLKD